MMEKKQHDKDALMFKKLSEAICLLATEINESRQQRRIDLEWFKSTFQCATKRDLDKMGDRIMSAISEFAAKQKAFNDRHGLAIDGLVTSVTGIQGDIQTLNDKIEELQNSPGGITLEDQALLDELTAQGSAVSDKLDAAAAALKALDEATPPVVPPVT